MVRSAGHWITNTAATSDNRVKQLKTARRQLPGANMKCKGYLIVLGTTQCTMFLYRGCNIEITRHKSLKSSSLWCE